MSGEILTLIVPTYNRAASLTVLLDAFVSEREELEGRVEVVIGDNASTDGTPEVTAAFAARFPAARVLRHAQNLGPDENFCRCIDAVRTRYFWILGDDDLPLGGVIGKVLSLLERLEPALVYLPSEWRPDVAAAARPSPEGGLRHEVLDAEDFARRVHVWFTFITGVVIDRSRLPEGSQDQVIRRFTGSRLVQLGWILPLLRSDAPFVLAADTCILATKDNTGGYPLLTVFGANFARIAHEALGRGSRLDRALVDGNLLNYLPGSVWDSRSAQAARFEAENPWPEMRRQVGDRPLFWLLLIPMGRFPRWLAQPFYQAWRVYHRLHREKERRRIGRASA